MIISLPGSASDYTSWETRPDLAKQYRMGFFHFSNNNLSIRRSCAEEIGSYDLAATKSEDVDVCFRVALTEDWIALREKGNVVRHKARSSFGAFVRQMWGWGYHVGYPYAKTGIKGLYLYWVSSSEHRIKFDVELPRFPFLVCMFLTDFHVMHALVAVALASALLGFTAPAAGLGGAAFFFAWRYLHDDRTAGLGLRETCQVAALHYCANVVFGVAAALGALRHRTFLLPCSIFRPSAPSEDRGTVPSAESRGETTRKPRVASPARAGGADARSAWSSTSGRRR